MPLNLFFVIFPPKNAYLGNFFPKKVLFWNIPFLKVKNMGKLFHNFFADWGKKSKFLAEYSPMGTSALSIILLPIFTKPLISEHGIPFKLHMIFRDKHQSCKKFWTFSSYWVLERSLGVLDWTHAWWSTWRGSLQICLYEYKGVAKVRHYGS